MTPLITPEELHRRIADGASGLRILDVRWQLDKPEGREDCRAGHIPGAVYVDLGTELSEPGLPLTRGRHPLPSLTRLQAAARRWGIHDGDTVVVYDAAGNTSAARAWWLLRSTGVTDVRVLDGALAGWKAAGFELESGAVEPAEGTVTLTGDHLEQLDIDDVASFLQRGTLIDARAAERYRGEVEPLDPRPGHIPGALSIPTAGNLDDSGRFLAPEQLRERFLSHGVDPQRPTAAYCGSGVNACHALLALQLAGFDAVLYPGSFSEWSRDPDRPVRTGESP
ncbi:sulfurtransferase [Nesterenkonia sp.]|uniref:sulfurtransferase n=1 Tax=Nesterenkonia sp. TaxID=704201 RepID=UPI00261B0899|nr:sulfurtransferase [Nesterenkonia sp.]